MMIRFSFTVVLLCTSMLADMGNGLPLESQPTHEGSQSSISDGDNGLSFQPYPPDFQTNQISSVQSVPNSYSPTQIAADLTTNYMNAYSPYYGESMNVGNGILSQIYNSGMDTVRKGSQYAWNGLALGIGTPVMVAKKGKEIWAGSADNLKGALSSKLTTAADYWNRLANLQRTWLQSSSQKANQALDSFNSYMESQMRNYANQLSTPNAIDIGQQAEKMKLSTDSLSVQPSPIDAHSLAQDGMSELQSSTGAASDMDMQNMGHRPAPSGAFATIEDGQNLLLSYSPSEMRVTTTVANDLSNIPVGYQLDSSQRMAANTGPSYAGATAILDQSQSNPSAMWQMAQQSINKLQTYSGQNDKEN